MLYFTQQYFTLLLSFWPDYGPCGCSADQSTPGTPTSTSSPASSLLIIFTIIIFLIIAIILDRPRCYPQIRALHRHTQLHIYVPEYQK